MAGFFVWSKRGQVVTFWGCKSVSIMACGLCTLQMRLFFINVSIQPKVSFITVYNFLRKSGSAAMSFWIHSPHLRRVVTVVWLQFLHEWDFVSQQSNTSNCRFLWRMNSFGSATIAAIASSVRTARRPWWCALLTTLTVERNRSAGRCEPQHCCTACENCSKTLG